MGCGGSPGGWLLWPTLCRPAHSPAGSGRALEAGQDGGVPPTVASRRPPPVYGTPNLGGGGGQVSRLGEEVGGKRD